MLIDTHCHINMMVKKEFDRPLTSSEISNAQAIVTQAQESNVQRIINVGTNLVESINCIQLAQRYAPIYAAIGLHPNDCTANWSQEYKEIAILAHKAQETKIVAIGECGLDRHYPDYNAQRQLDAFRAQIELALECDLALIVHTRDAPDETLHALQEFKGQITRGVIHCFSEDQSFADTALSFGFVLGIGGALTYPKNSTLRSVMTTIGLNKIILETDAPFLPPQPLRGKQNHPKNIEMVARYLAELRNESFETVAEQTTNTAYSLFRL